MQTTLFNGIKSEHLLSLQSGLSLLCSYGDHVVSIIAAMKSVIDLISVKSWVKKAISTVALLLISSPQVLRC